MTEAEAGKQERLQIVLGADEIRAIDDWRFRWRMPSRSAAIRALLRLGLAETGAPSAEGMKSPKIRVVDGHPGKK